MDLGCEHPRLPAWICLALGVFLPGSVQLTEQLCVCGYKMQQVSSEGRGLGRREGSHKECQPGCRSRSSGLTREKLGLDRGMAVNCYFLSVQRSRVLKRKKCSLASYKSHWKSRAKGGRAVVLLQRAVCGHSGGCWVSFFSCSGFQLLPHQLWRLCQGFAL